MMAETSNKQFGFTLIELMIAIVIIAVLLAIAVPNYRSHVMKSKRVEAMTALNHIASLQEQFFSENRRYTTGVEDLGLTKDGNATRTLTENGYYQIRITDNNGYRLTAVAQGGQANDVVGKFRLWADGSKQHQLKAGGSYINNWPE